MIQPIIGVFAPMFLDNWQSQSDIFSMVDIRKMRILSKEESDALLARCRDKNGKLRIKAAPSLLSKKHEKTIHRILWAMEPKKAEFIGSFITDESTLYDFPLNDKELDQLNRRIGWKCSEEDRLAELAAAIDTTPPRTFKSYVFRCNLAKAAQYAVATHGKVKNKAKLVRRYKETIMQLAELLPAAPDKSMEGYSLRVDKQGYVDGTHPKKPNTAVEFIRWEKLLSMPVITPFGIDKTVGKLLFEATFIDFDQRGIQAELKKLKDMVKSIKAESKRPK
jgi:hypothetical protein